jgi:hypothetical protein
MYVYLTHETLCNCFYCSLQIWIISTLHLVSKLTAKSCWKDSQQQDRSDSKSLLKSGRTWNFHAFTLAERALQNFMSLQKRWEYKLSKKTEDVVQGKIILYYPQLKDVFIVCFLEEQFLVTTELLKTVYNAFFYLSHVICCNFREVQLTVINYSYDRNKELFLMLREVSHVHVNLRNIA